VRDWAAELEAKITDRTARPAVVGLGYVGLPLLAELARAGFRPLGVDVNAEKIAALRSGRSYVLDVRGETLAPYVADGRIEVSTDFDLLRAADTIDICVPTPLRKTRDPDVSYIVAATEEIAQRLSPGRLIILESTTYPGTTEELMLPRLEKTGLKVGRDFFLAFSPERVDPGNPRYTTRNIPKVVGGITPACTRLAALLYGTTIEKVVTVSSPGVAEMVKLLENTFRSVNIALVNEMALLSERMDIDVWEVIEAAATKPFGFMPFYPGPGLGGHCIPIDPFYLSWKARLTGFEARMIELAGQINRSMPEFVLNKVRRTLGEDRKAVKSSRILILGVAYKPNIDDLRESPALDIFRMLVEEGGEVSYHDPFVPSFVMAGETWSSQALTPEALRAADIVVITTDHAGVDYDLVVREARRIVDTRNALKGRRDPKIVRL